MPFTHSNYQGDKTYAINCTGDAVVGDEVCFERATFSGSFRNAKFDGFERITGTIIRDSYGHDKQQHTFTIKLPNGSEMRIKGRNLYAESTWRKPWTDESQRANVADEKHARGNNARLARDMRKSQSLYC